jgi:hypothetical protein
MQPFRHTVLPALLLAAGGPLLCAADGFFTIQLDGSIQPMHFQRDSELIADDRHTYPFSTEDARDLAWRVGVTGIVRIPTMIPVRPVVGLALSYHVIQNSLGGGESDIPPADPTVALPPSIEDAYRYRGTVRTADLLFGLSYLANRHIYIDVLPYVGIGRGGAKSHFSGVDGRLQTFDPDLDLSEVGIRVALNLVSDYGMTLSIFGGYQRTHITEEGFQLDVPAPGGTAAVPTPRKDNTYYTGVVIGLGWGFSL